MAKIQVTDEEAMDQIHRQLSGNEWDADTMDAVALWVEATGRTVDDPNDDVEGDA